MGGKFVQREKANHYSLKWVTDTVKRDLRIRSWAVEIETQLVGPMRIRRESSVGSQMRENGFPPPCSGA